MRLLMVVLCWSLVALSWGQTKKKIDTDAYYRWKTISEEKISYSGKWISYIENAYRGNDTLVLLDKGQSSKAWGRVTKYHLDPYDRFVVFNQGLDYDSIRQLKIDGVKKKKWPKDSLGIYAADVDSVYWFTVVDNFEAGEKGGDLILISHDESFSLPGKEVEEKKKKKCRFLGKKKSPEKIVDTPDLEGNVLTIFNYSSRKTLQHEHVLESSLIEQGYKYAYVQQVLEDTIKISKLMIGELKSDRGNTGDFGEEKELFSINGEISNLTWDSGAFLAFNVSVDTTEAKKQQLFLYGSFVDDKTGEVKDSLIMILDTVSEHFKSYQCVSNSPMEFGKGDTRLFFKVGIKPKDKPKDTVPEDEMAKLDVWSWTDGMIQPQQLKSAKKDALGLIDYVYDINEKRVVQLQDSSIQKIDYLKDHSGSYALLSDQSSYLHEMTWDFWYYDVYRVHLLTGEKELLLEHAYGWDYALSPTGNNFTYWNSEDSSWYLKNLNFDKEFNLTKGIEDVFYAREHDVPSSIPPAGKVYWFEKEQSCAIESQNELWIIPILGGPAYDVKIGKPYKFTKGKEKNESYQLIQLDDDQRFYSFYDFYLKSFNHETKSEGLYHYGFKGLEKIGEWDAAIMTIKQAKNSKDLLFEKMSFSESYNLFLGDSVLGKVKQITNINPQQDEYKWGTVELFKWRDYNGKGVEGLLYKPEDFDASKSYPMIVYFYELYTDDIHIYYRPKPTASIIYPTEYVSNDYVVFIPDIRYEIGHPAEGAYNAIMSGTDAILRAYPNIDSTRMGLQGQSWGGYQTAQMVTMTNRYKCAMAGAPVSNMFSAYGGVRWGSGLSRTFQYETGQSRIGATIWEAPELYVENSPLFHLPKVETPLLIMHNDGDGAVPWYQGIELFQGLRRLQKPVWMLNYNDDEHNLMKDANRMDLSIRMRQFFDHYLQGESAPDWMTKGVPAVDKGK